jgi:[ribosomal protein S5]-alanine N-acetyltransferase
MNMVVLRRWRPEDAEWYAASTKDADIRRWTTEPPDLTAERVRAAIAALSEGSLAWAAVDAGTGELVGNAAVALKDGVAEPSYWVAAPARGRGLATAILIELVRRCREAGHRRIEIVVHADNAASARVARKAGFEPVGFERHPSLGRSVRYRHFS